MKKIIYAATAALFLIYTGCSPVIGAGQENREAVPKTTVQDEELQENQGNEEAIQQEDSQMEEADGQEEAIAYNDRDVCTDFIPAQGQEGIGDISQAPSIELKVIEGPSYGQGGQVCYYRIYAKVDGDPLPDLRFSKDDSNGAWGTDIAQVNLGPGQSYMLEATAENDIGIASDSILLEWVDPEAISQPKIDYNDSKKFKIDVSLDEQRVRVYYEGDLLREMACSGGAPETPTPVGTFKTTQKIHYSWLPRFDVGAYYFVRFYGSYLFHSLPFDEDGNLIQEEAEKLGQPASHGCIRLKVEDARWLYEKLPLGVEVNIY